MGTAAFTGTILGGNARGNPAQKLTYNLTVPPGKHDLDVALTLPTDPGDTRRDRPRRPQRGDAVDLVQPRPDHRRDHLDLAQRGGQPDSRPVALRRGRDQPRDGRGVPAGRHGHGLVQPAGRLGRLGSAVGRQRSRAAPPSTLKLRFHNTSPVPLAVQTDARTEQLQTVQLSPLGAGSTVPLPLSVDDLSDAAGVPRPAGHPAGVALRRRRPRLLRSSSARVPVASTSSVTCSRRRTAAPSPRPRSVSPRRLTSARARGARTSRRSDRSPTRERRSARAPWWPRRPR